MNKYGKELNLKKLVKEYNECKKTSSTTFSRAQRGKVVGSKMKNVKKVGLTSIKHLKKIQCKFCRTNIYSRKRDINCSQPFGTCLKYFLIKKKKSVWEETATSDQG